MTKTVLILGGYGVFGGRLARRLSRNADRRVIIAGRNLDKARSLADKLGCEAEEIDARAADLIDRVSDLEPDIIVDAAGPFQAYKDDPYRVARIAMQVGAHYLDLSDDGPFTAEISQLDDSAVKAGVSILSGVSSVPALSSVVAAHLAAGIEDVHAIDIAILPGNRAPRGLSVIRSILGQVGRPLRLWHGNAWTSRPAWSDLKRIDLHVVGAPSVTKRRASLIGAPDLLLFPEAFGARSVTFRAGLELSLMQFGLWVLHWLPRLKLFPSLEGLAVPLKWIADRLETIGTDRGGMHVCLTGQSADGLMLQRVWTLIVEQGDGPFIPGLPAEVLIEKICMGEIDPGARPGLREFSLPEFEAAVADLSISMGEVQRPYETLFQRILQGKYESLPSRLQELHMVSENRKWRGEASVRRGAGRLSKVAGWIAGFPPAAASVSIEVEMRATGKGETWIRRFGQKRFKSYLSMRSRRRKPVLIERFGLMSFQIDLGEDAGKLRFPVQSGRVLGIPLPAFLRPASDTFEYVDDQGRACFSVRVSLPIAGLIAQYEGWLKPVNAQK